MEDGLSKKIESYIAYDAGEETGTKDDKEIVDKIQVLYSFSNDIFVNTSISSTI